MRSVTAIEVISIAFLFYSNKWRTWCTVVPKDEPVHDLLRVDETIMDGSAGAIHILVMLVRVSHHDDGRIFMESRLLIIKDGRHSYRDVQSRDEHEEDEVMGHIYLVPCSIPVP